MAFKHVPLTREQLERRTNQKRQIIDPANDPRFEVFRAKVGINTVRILPPTWKDWQHWAYDLWLHRNIGPDNGSYLCLRRHLREPCPICEEEQALQQDGDSEAAKQIYARKTRIAWIINRGEEDPNKNPQLWYYGYTIDEDISGRCFNKKTGQEIDILDPDEGFDVSFRRTDTKPFPKTDQIEIDRDPSPIDDDPQWQEYYLNFVVKNPIPDVLTYYEYDHLYQVLHGRTPSRRVEEDTGQSESRRPPPPDTEQEEPSQEEPSPRPSRRAAPPEDSRPAEESEQEQLPPPSRQRGAPAAEQEHADVAPPARRRPPPVEEQGNGHDAAAQGQEQIRRLRREVDEQPAPPRSRREAPSDDPPPPRRRPPPPQ